MNRRRHHLGELGLVVFAVLGIAISAYLTVVHYAGAPLVCSNVGIVDCSAVTSSASSMVPGTSIPVTVPGILWFAVSGGLAVWAAIAGARRRPEPGWLRPAHLVWAVAGIAVVLYLVSAEVSLRRICEWCTSVHLLVLMSLLIALTRWQRTQPHPDASPRRSFLRSSSTGTGRVLSADAAHRRHARHRHRRGQRRHLAPGQRDGPQGPRR